MKLFLYRLPFLLRFRKSCFRVARDCRKVFLDLRFQEVGGNQDKYARIESLFECPDLASRFSLLPSLHRSSPWITFASTIANT